MIIPSQQPYTEEDYVSVCLWVSNAALADVREEDEEDILREFKKEKVNEEELLEVS